ncbi:MAG: hypothetical protein ABIG61_14075 [Planctomycetota bacterium]
MKTDKTIKWSQEVENSLARFNQVDVRDEIVDVLENCRKRLPGKISPSITLVEQCDPQKLFGQNCLTYICMLLFRAISVIEGAIESLNNKNILSMVLCIRAHYETTGAIGFFLSRLTDYYAKRILFKEVNQVIYGLTTGSRDKYLCKAPEAKNILTLIDAADKFLKREIIKNLSDEKKMLRENYDFLSEFCHPNFHSHTLGAEFNVEEKTVRFLRKSKILEREFGLFGYLAISGPIFLLFFDRIYNLIKTNETMPKAMEE